jgi:dTDP-4-dehydrorhamnose 3,5-epimerase-like enzyme
MKKKLNVSYQDYRGKIIDIFVSSPKDHCSIVTFNKNSVRGNHFHKKSCQYTVVLEGKILLISQKVNKKGKLIGKVKKEILTELSMAIHKQRHAHALKALKKSKALVFVDGIRGGKKYSSDTFPIHPKLI